DIEYLKENLSTNLFDKRLGSTKFPLQSGIWRFRELVHPLAEDKHIISRPEGNTNLYRHPNLVEFSDIKNISLKHEGENPTGSFKDRGMSPGVTEARRVGKQTVACASTGNTSASMTAYASMGGLTPVVFIPEGMIAYGKLAQALAYGAKVLQIEGNFDKAMSLVQESCDELGMYLLNSINPFRLEGQKTIIYEILQQKGWEPPDWIVVPAGNLGNTSAFGKAFKELYEIGLISKVPRIAAIQATGSNPFYQTITSDSQNLLAVEDPETLATAIKIGNPVSWRRAKQTIEYTRGVVAEVTDQQIMDAKAVIDGSGIGCEPASAASLAGAGKLRREGVIDSKEEVVCITTGHILKDPDATVNYHLGKLYPDAAYMNNPHKIKPTLDEVKKHL
ncbi:MAG: threonine synthase, partial [Candidatus Altiarchaeales archaeon]|nr:threonine synthase [Candidatus Altiarchaeales archaeon]